ncbi:MAG: DUF4474 domain-containing protein [Clostridia bacterium]|nr:DUF4474 domain-containing protein [Oscillospiraceae bacterium]MBQ7960827.1 DUF4474 domain-containing protein [Clostridia bacterium]
MKNKYVLVVCLLVGSIFLTSCTYTTENGVSTYTFDSYYFESILKGDKPIKDACMDAVNIWKDMTRSGDLDTFLHASLGAQKNESLGTYHMRQDTWQRFFGYNDLYDIAFYIGTDFTGTTMDVAKFPFEHEGEDYIFWAWKGDYINLGAGAEMGIYYGGGPHWKADRALAFPMALNLRHNTYGTVVNYYATEPHWWITGFNPQYQTVQADDMTAVYTVDFSANPQMLQSFKDTCDDLTGWSFNGNAATFSF